jgi:hypothetical protein
MMVEALGSLGMVGGDPPLPNGRFPGRSILGRMESPRVSVKKKLGIFAI